MILAHVVQINLLYMHGKILDYTIAKLSGGATCWSLGLNVMLRLVELRSVIAI